MWPESLKSDSLITKISRTTRLCSEFIAKVKLLILFKTPWLRLFLVFSGLTLSSIAIAEPSSPPAFSGWNVSAGVGLLIPNVETKGLLELDAPGIQYADFHLTQIMTNVTANGGIRFGYNLVSGQAFLFGLAVDANFANSNMTLNSLVTEANSGLRIPVASTIKLTNQFAALLKIGALVGNRGLFYGLIGPQWGRFAFGIDTSFFQNIGVIVQSALSAQNTAYQPGLLVGFGSEMLLTQSFSLALEYTHTFYGQPTLAGITAPVTLNGGVFPGSSYSVENTYKAQVNNILLRLGYYFCT